MSVRLCINDVVLVNLKGNKTRNTENIHMGVVKYVGFIHGHKMTEYVGIQLIEPTANGHNGTIDGFQYFDCRKGYGIHIRLINVIRKLEASDVTVKMGEIVKVFKTKLNEYERVLSQRNDYIKELKDRHRHLSQLLKGCKCHKRISSSFAVTHLNGRFSELNDSELSFPQLPNKLNANVLKLKPSESDGDISIASMQTDLSLLQDNTLRDRSNTPLLNTIDENRRYNATSFSDQTFESRSDSELIVNGNRNGDSTQSTFANTDSTSSSLKTNKIIKFGKNKKKIQTQPTIKSKQHQSKRSTITETETEASSSSSSSSSSTDNEWSDSDDTAAENDKIYKYKYNKHRKQKVNIHPLPIRLNHKHSLLQQSECTSSINTNCNGYGSPLAQVCINPNREFVEAVSPTFSSTRPRSGQGQRQFKFPVPEIRAATPKPKKRKNNRRRSSSWNAPLIDQQSIAMLKKQAHGHGRQNGNVDWLPLTYRKFQHQQPRVQQTPFPFSSHNIMQGQPQQLNVYTSRHQMQYSAPVNVLNNYPQPQVDHWVQQQAAYYHK